MRIAVFGSSGAGKTTFSKALETRADIPRLELDAVNHLAGWQPRETKDFRRIVSEFTKKPAWIVDGNYGAVRALVWSRADVVVFLDLPRWKVTAQLIRRSLGRLITREHLWNGNREEWRNFISVDPEKNLILWSWTRHRLRREQFDAGEKNPVFAQTRFVRLTHRREQRAFIENIAG